MLAWLQANYVQFLQALSVLILALTLIVRLAVPTSSADGALERIGAALTTLMNILHVPVLVKIDGDVSMVTKPAEMKALMTSETPAGTGAAGSLTVNTNLK